MTFGIKKKKENKKTISKTNSMSLKWIWFSATDIREYLKYNIDKVIDNTFAAAIYILWFEIKVQAVKYIK